jgi:hypothetical protein
MGVVIVVVIAVVMMVVVIGVVIVVVIAVVMMVVVIGVVVVVAVVERKKRMIQSGKVTDINIQIRIYIYKTSDEVNSKLSVSALMPITKIKEGGGEGGEWGGWGWGGGRERWGGKGGYWREMTGMMAVVMWQDDVAVMAWR